MKPIKFEFPDQVVKLANKYPARKFKPVRWKEGWALAKKDGALVCERDLR